MNLERNITISESYGTKSLPKLPVPDLHKTCERYLRSLEPLLTPIEYQRTHDYVKKFLEPGGLGEFLQKKLVERARISKTSWLEDWWNDLAYLSYRDSLVINVNYFYHFEEDPYLSRDSTIQLRRAALLIDSAWNFRELILSGKLVIDQNNKGQPLCMYQYSYLFHSCRIPIIKRDKVKTYDPNHHRHIVVVKDDQFYAVAMQDHDGHQLTLHEIERYSNYQ